MRRFLTLLAVALAVVVSSCSKFDDTSIWDKLNDHEKRIAVLEELCKQMNTNIDALQTIVEVLEKKDYVTNVTPIREDGKIVGYTISFAKSDSITIYNGKDGVNGVDGYAPKVGVMKDTDGVYYWIVDGEWLLDNKGNKIKAIGVDGENGVTPRLKIENDYWYVSYDEEETWVEQGRAIVDDDTNDGSIFSSVTYDDEYVYFNLTDGSMITLSKHDKENIQFEDLHVKAICCKNWDTNNDGELSYAEAAAVTDIGTVFKSNTNIVAFTEFKYFTNITQIPDDAFYGCCNLWKLEWPQNITNIGEDAFSGCSSVKSWYIYKNITSIGRGAFSNCGGTLYVDCNNISTSAFSSNKFTEIIFGESVVTIGKYAFYNADSIESIKIPNNITYIGEHAFESCSNLKSLVIGDGVSVIEDEAFGSLDKLESVVIGAGIVKIGEHFYKKSESVSLYIKALIPPSLPSGYCFLYYENGVYRRVPENLCIYVPKESVDAYKKSWSNYSSKIVGYDFEE